MTTQIARNKQYGYEVEVQALKALKALWPTLERTGASNQKHAHDPDLILRGTNPPLLLIVTKDKGQHPMMLHIQMDDFLALVTLGAPDVGVAVQVKGRAKTWIGGLFAGLQEAVKEWQGPGFTTSRMTR